ncbi:MAG: ABC-2 family transporter protein [Muribaculaceae bacterium]|nr:ABC-2 family transporter protein [Roseburia sp.]MCM1430007.1 ABC-2 family transporter protein [Muribaculaceae bacterium]MCM1492966.1 ABC-2 family transporter protein [Muribaculaceae bacterium]
MKKLKRYGRLYRVLASQFLKTILQSKVDFLMGLFGFFFTQIMGIAFLYLVFEQIPSLQGWTLEQLIFIYGFAQIPRGIDHLLTDNIWLVSWWMVIDGDFDRYMLRPMNVFFQVICEKLQPDALGELLVGTILVGMSLSKGILTVDAVHILLFFVSILAGALIYTAVKLFFASLAFWVKQSGPFLQVAYEMANFAKYPTEIYGKVVQFLITWVIPFAFVAYLPASYFLMGKGAAVIGVECVIAVVFFAIAYALFCYGTRRYESAGN